MKNHRLVIATLIFFMLSANVFAQASNDLSQLSYPELEVTPRASERLEIELKNERKRRWMRHWPIQVSALATLLAASSADPKTTASKNEKDRLDESKKTAQMISGSWLVGTVLLSAAYRPYDEGYRQIVALPNKSQRERLTRERLAEEALYKPSRLAWKLQWFSVATELAATIPLISKGDEDTKTFGSIAAAAALLPLIFEYDWTRTATQHREYKKKIYGPVAGPVLLKENETYRVGYSLSFVF